MPQYPTAAHSVCQKNYIVDKNGVAGAKPPYRSSAICATASCRGFVWLTASILAWSGAVAPHSAPARTPGVYAQRLCTMQRPTKHTQPFSHVGRGLGLGIENLLYFYKKQTFSTTRCATASHCGTFFICILHQKNEKLLLIEKKCTIILTIAQKAHKK